jgi:multicomponent Na+:H+ antiporter subunit F
MLRLLNPLLLCVLLCLVRIARGPTPADRSVAVDILGVVVAGICGIFSWFTGREYYIDIGAAWVLQSFIGALALSKHMEGKRLDD